MDVKEAGGRGGITTRIKYGKEHYKRIGQLGGKSTQARNKATKLILDKQPLA